MAIASTLATIVVMFVTVEGVLHRANKAMYKSKYPGPMDFNCTSPPLEVSILVSKIKIKIR